MTSASSDEHWHPRAWQTAGSIATYVVTSLPGGLAGSFQTSYEHPAELRRWVASWLADRCAQIEERAKETLDWPDSFLYLVVFSTSEKSGVQTASDRWEVTEFGQGSFPACPESWPPVTLRELLGFAIADLERQSSTPEAP